MPSVNPIEITVTFDANQAAGNRFAWSPAGPPNPVANLAAVTDGSSVYALVFTLQSPNSPGATWPPAPVVWSDSLMPPPPPPGTTMPTPGSGQFVVGVDNQNMGGSPETFGFQLAVHYNGTTFVSPDPEIVLQPPS